MTQELQFTFTIQLMIIICITTIDDSDDYDIKLSDSYDTVSYNNTFSSISASDANMWIKVYIDVGVTDNSVMRYLMLIYKLSKML